LAIIRTDDQPSIKRPVRLIVDAHSVDVRPRTLPRLASRAPTHPSAAHACQARSLSASSPAPGTQYSMEGVRRVPRLRSGSVRGASPQMPHIWARSYGYSLGRAPRRSPPCQPCQPAYRHANLVVMVVMVRYGLFRAAPPGSHWRDWFPSHRGDDRGFVSQLHGRRLGGPIAVEAELHGRTSATSLDGTPAGVSGKREGEAPTG